MRRDATLDIIHRALVDLVPGAAPAFLRGRVEITETLPGTGEHTRTWTGPLDEVADRVCTAVKGRTTPAVPSPLAQADEAKHNGDTAGVLFALTAGDRSLTEADWYPARHGDLVHVAYEAGGELPEFGETYLIARLDGGLYSMQLLAHTYALAELDADEMVGCFAVDAVDDPLYQAWFEAGPQRITIVRDGRVIHDGPGVRP